MLLSKINNTRFVMRDKRYPMKALFFRTSIGKAELSLDIAHHASPTTFRVGKPKSWVPYSVYARIFYSKRNVCYR